MVKAQITTALAAACLLAAAVPATGESEREFRERIAAAAANIVEERARFALWAACYPVRLWVRFAIKDAEGIGLTRDNIETAARSRLRAARLYDDAGIPVLEVNVGVVASAFDVDVTLSKILSDTWPGGGEEKYAITWVDGTFGVHGGRPDYILSKVTSHVDRFIDEYLRVNAEACGGPQVSK